MAVPQSFVYLDYAASAPESAASQAAQRAYDGAPYAGANPNSLHTMGRQASAALNDARNDLARCLGGGFRGQELTFTSGGTESNNLALLGLAEGVRMRDRRRNRVLVAAIEHDSVLDVVPVLRNRGFEVTLVQPGRDGRVHPEAFAAQLSQETALVSLMSANNETGVIQPLAEVARLAHAVGAAVHTDAVQAFGRMGLALDDVDAVSIAAHKIGGPVGIAALACRRQVPLRPQSFGGGQEFGHRAGTQDVRGALGFAAAACDCCEHLAEQRAAATRLAQALLDELKQSSSGEDGIRLTVPLETVGWDGRLPGIVSLLVPPVDSETLVLACDQRGFAVSAASACSSGSLDASHVLLAMGVPRDEALCSLRVSFDHRVNRQDIVSFAQTLADIRHQYGGRRR